MTFVAAIDFCNSNSWALDRFENRCRNAGLCTAHSIQWPDVGTSTLRRQGGSIQRRSPSNFGIARAIRNLCAIANSLNRWKHDVRELEECNHCGPIASRPVCSYLRLCRWPREWTSASSRRVRCRTLIQPNWPLIVLNRASADAIRSAIAPHPSLFFDRSYCKVSPIEPCGMLCGISQPSNFFGFSYGFCARTLRID